MTTQTHPALRATFPFREGRPFPPHWANSRISNRLKQKHGKKTWDKGDKTSEMMKEVLSLQIKYSKQALKFLLRQEKKIANRIRAGIDGLTTKPPKGDIKQMQDVEKGTLRLRISSYRVIF